MTYAQRLIQLCSQELCLEHRFRAARTAKGQQRVFAELARVKILVAQLQAARLVGRWDAPLAAA